MIILIMIRNSKMILHNFWIGVLGSILINISPSDIFQTIFTRIVRLFLATASIEWPLWPVVPISIVPQYQMTHSGLSLLYLYKLKSYQCKFNDETFLCFELIFNNKKILHICLWWNAYFLTLSHSWWEIIHEITFTVLWPQASPLAVCN